MSRVCPADPAGPPQQKTKWRPARRQTSEIRISSISSSPWTKYIFLNGIDRILIRISLEFAPRSPIGNKQALVEAMACRLLTQLLLTHICGNRGRWVHSGIRIHFVWAAFRQSFLHVFFWWSDPAGSAGHRRRRDTDVHLLPRATTTRANHYGKAEIYFVEKYFPCGKKYSPLIKKKTHCKEKYSL